MPFYPSGQRTLKVSLSGQWEWWQEEFCWCSPWEMLWSYRGGGGDATGGLSSLSMKYYWIEVLYDRALIGATNTTLSSPSPPAEILSAYSSNHCSVLAGPSLFGQIKLLFCTPGREERGTELEIKTLFTISSPDLIYIQKQSHNMDFRLVELCKLPLIGSVFN